MPDEERCPACGRADADNAWECPGCGETLGLYEEPGVVHPPRPTTKMVAMPVERAEALKMAEKQNHEWQTTVEIAEQDSDRLTHMAYDAYRALDRGDVDTAKVILKGTHDLYAVLGTVADESESQ
jgi:hypothetical protein